MSADDRSRAAAGPLISVVIPAYNAARFLGATLDSVLAQTYRPIEVIVVDDGSTDDTEAVATAYGPPVRYHRQVNAGSSAARNSGLDLVRGAWVAFLDADDLWVPEKLARQVEVVRADPGLACVHTGYYVFGDDPRAATVAEVQPDRVYTFEHLLAKFTVLPSTSLVRADTRARFKAWAPVAHDMIYFADLSREGGFAYLPEKLVGYRKHPASITGAAGAPVRSAQDRLRYVEEAGLDADGYQAAKRAVLQGLADEVRLARWLREWDRYWGLRDLLRTRWTLTEPLPAVATERVFPPVVYRIRDLFA